MNKQTTSDEILNKLYAAYGTDSGILFGIKEMDIVKAIVNFTLDYSHPPTETIKEEDVQVGGFTKGKWEIGGTSRGLNNYYIKADNQNIAQIFSSIPECEANAKRIVQAVNNFDAMYRFIKELNRRLLDSQNRVGGSSSFGDTYHVIFDGNKSVGQVMEEILNNISNK